MIKKIVPVFYIPQASPWPILFSVGIFNMFCILLIWAEGQVTSISIRRFLLLRLLIAGLWFSDVYCESGSLGFSSFEMDNSLKVSMVWFIGREIIFFFSFFFGYIALDGSTEISTGSTWPPLYLPLIRATSIPLLNTIILLSRGISLTWSHHIILTGYRDEALVALRITLLLATSFSLLQMFEYLECDFSINDSFYGRIFFMTTGFHGLHVILGSIILIICLVQIGVYNEFRRRNHVFFEIRSWYWHFVDVVWLFLFLIIYCNLI